MLNISNELKQRFDNGDPQCCYIFFPGLNLLITEKDIKQGSFNLDNKCNSGTWYAPGDIVSAECSFTLMNSDSKFDDYNFSGQSYVVSLGVKGYSDNFSDNYFSGAEQFRDLVSDMIDQNSVPKRIRYAGDPKGMSLSDYYGEYFDFENGTVATVQKLGIGDRSYKFTPVEDDRILMGVFYNNKFEKSYGKKEINISGLDTLYRTDMPFPRSALGTDKEPTLEALFTALQNFGFFESLGFVPQFENTNDLKSILSSYNAKTTLKEDDFTVRQLLGWLAQLGGMAVTVTRQGKIRFVSIKDTPINTYELTPSNRQAFSLLSSEPVNIVGTSYSINNGKSYFTSVNGAISTDNNIPTGITYDLSANELFKNLTSSAARKAIINEINSKHKGVSIMPFTGYCPAAPYLEMLDAVHISDLGYTSRITHVSYKLNCWSKVEAAGTDISTPDYHSLKGGASNTAQTQAKNYVEMRSEVVLYEDSTGFNSTAEEIENLSIYSAFIITVKRATDGGSVPLLCIRNEKDIRGSFIWRQNSTTVYEYFIQATDNGNNSLTVNVLTYYVTTSGTTAKQQTELLIVKISALS